MGSCVHAPPQHPLTSHPPENHPGASGDTPLKQIKRVRGSWELRSAGATVVNSKSGASVPNSPSPAGQTAIQLLHRTWLLPEPHWLSCLPALLFLPFHANFPREHFFLSFWIMNFLFLSSFYFTAKFQRWRKSFHVLHIQFPILLIYPTNRIHLSQSQNQYWYIIIKGRPTLFWYP
jgi:hypothetical protein